MALAPVPLMEEQRGLVKTKKGNVASQEQIPPRENKIKYRSQPWEKGVSVICPTHGDVLEMCAGLCK